MAYSPDLLPYIHRSLRGSTTTTSRASALTGALRGTALAATALFACGCSDDAPPPTTPPEWQVVLDEADLDRVALSVWGASKDAVFVVGGPLGNSGRQALALRYDGSQWRDLAPGGDDTFWWVAGTSANDVWMVGENGRISHYDGNGFEEHTAPTTATVWGVWPFAADDVWAVAGTPAMGNSAPNDIVLHYDGSSWTQETLPVEHGVALYKVWGPTPDDLYVVGESGTIWHRKAGSWTDESGAANGTLFTVHGCSAEEVYAVGGFSVLRSNGDGSWSDIKEDLALDLNSGVNGVSCTADGVGFAGGGGLKGRLFNGQWVNDFTIAPFADLHAVWAASKDEIWVVGGDFFSPASDGPRKGVVGRYGSGTAASSVP